MNIIIDKRYLELPVNSVLKEKKLIFRNNGVLILDVTCKLDPKTYDSVQYLDLGRFLGQELELECQPKIPFFPTLVNSLPNENLYVERYRPALHFTSARGWLNDPNGLIWYEGNYHMFFQHNPCDTCWGNMHWGHAVSRDLLHWKEKEIALFPDEMGTMFSGSAIVDTQNLTGFQNGAHQVILLYYTAAGDTSLLSKGVKTTQCLAYSTDGGDTFQKYHNNPILPHLVDINRDPKIIYSSETGTYLMVLYLTEHQYALFASRNLLNWTKMQEISLPNDAECPDFYPLSVNGKVLWVFSGASDQYLVGEIKNSSFVPLQEARSLQYSVDSYASQTFSNLNDGRTIRLAWNRTQIPNPVFNCAMTTPTEMSLKEKDGDYLLCANPVRELNSIVKQIDRIESLVLSKGTSAFVPLLEKLQEIRLEFSFSGNTAVSLSLLGLDIQLKPHENTLTCKQFTSPIFAKEGIVRLHLITDVHAIELYVADGESFLCVGHFADYNLNKVTLTVDLGNIDLHFLESRALCTVWKEE